MKKSYIYKMAMASVIRDDSVDMTDTLDILETLMEDKRVAEYGEKRAAEEKAADGA